jgi:hypothetical protein
VQQVKIDRVDSQAFEAALTCFRHVRARSVMRIHFGDDEHAIALTVDCIRHDFFRAAFAVHLGGIDQSHAKINAQAQRRDFICVRVFVFTHSPCSLTERRYTRAIWQLKFFHSLSQFIRTISPISWTTRRSSVRRTLQISV